MAGPRSRAGGTRGAPSAERLSDSPLHHVAGSGAAIAELVAHYVARARAVLDHRQQQLDDARDRAAAQRASRLADDARGRRRPRVVDAACHDRRRRARAGATSPNACRRRTCRSSSVKDDARLIRTEVDRCQVILDGMSGRAPDGAAIRDRATRRQTRLRNSFGAG